MKANEIEIEVLIIDTIHNNNYLYLLLHNAKSKIEDNLFYYHIIIKDTNVGTLGTFFF